MWGHHKALGVGGHFWAPSCSSEMGHRGKDERRAAPLPSRHQTRCPAILGVQGCPRGPGLHSWGSLTSHSLSGQTEKQAQSLSASCIADTLLNPLQHLPSCSSYHPQCTEAWRGRTRVGGMGLGLSPHSCCPSTSKALKSTASGKLTYPPRSRAGVWEELKGTPRLRASALGAEDTPSGRRVKQRSRTSDKKAARLE